MPSRRPPLLLYFILVLIQSVLDLVIFDDEDDHHLFNNSNYNYGPYGGMPPKDLHGDMYGTGYFRHWSNVPRMMYDFLMVHFKEPIEEPRNIYFKYSAAENRLRRRRKCKISTANRILNFLHSFSEATLLKTGAIDNGWNISSNSRDWPHALMQFVGTFEYFLRPLSGAAREAMKGLFYGYPTAYQSLDGSMYRRLRTYSLRDMIDRRDYYDWKRNYPESINVQAVVDGNGLIRKCLTGVPGRMCDNNTAKYICNDDAIGSTLVDDGYPNLPQYIGPDGSDVHKAERVRIEWAFGRNKGDWSMTGHIYPRSSVWHNLAIRASMILSNMKLIFTELERRENE